MNNRTNLRLTPDKSYLTVNTFIVMLVVISMVGATYYFYNLYTAISNPEPKNKIKPADCPDYWETVVSSINSDGKRILTCKNPQKIGDGNKKCGWNMSVTFNPELYNGPDEVIAKCNYAKQCGIHWTGYSGNC